MNGHKSIYTDTTEFRYIITETGGPSSLDPLDGDQTQNLPIQRMIYATPVEVNSKGELQSKVLEDFKYDSVSKKLTWIVKSDVKFSDGSVITPEDIAFAVARMVFTRPKFPIIENIEGVDDWVKSPSPLNRLPSGIILTGNKIEIKFTKEVDHPLFRFSLEIFSIIPKKCVDLTTNKLTCTDVPTSGHYKIVEQTTTFIRFDRIQENILGELAPKYIRFEFQVPKNVFTESFVVDEHTVIQGNEIKLSLEELAVLKKNLKTAYLPSARIAVSILNPEVGAFKDPKCRLVFAEAYRKAFVELATKGFKVESSVFTDVLPGYITSTQLSENSSHHLTPADRTKCIEQMKTEPPPWAIVKEEKGSIYSLIMEKVYGVLGIEAPKPFVFETTDEERRAFDKNEIAMLGASTGFWALDPAGDIQMLFTPNMHKLLRFVTVDTTLQNLIKGLKKPNGEIDPVAFKKINQYIFDQGLFNVFANIRRFYASKDLDLIAELPISITSPAPWQVFRVK